MQILKELGRLFKENPSLILVTPVAMVIGAGMGALAFFYGWLG